MLGFPKPLILGTMQVCWMVPLPPRHQPPQKQLQRLPAAVPCLQKDSIPKIMQASVPLLFAFKIFSVRWSNPTHAKPWHPAAL